MSREMFLNRVREAAEKGRKYRPARTDDLPKRPGYASTVTDLIGQFLSAVEAAGGTAYRAKDTAAAAEQLTLLLEKYDAKRALCWEHSILDSIDLATILTKNGAALFTYKNLRTADPSARESAVMAADIGITSADFAIAETGSLVVCSRPGQERLASLLPPVHVAVISSKIILPDLFDLYEKLSASEDDLPSNVTLITGPSKTGDIELKLTTGVHGPGKWHVIVMDEE